MPEVSSTTGTQKWDAEQQRMAAIIIQTGQSMGMSRRDILTGLATAMQESSLRNIDYGDRDSLGLFQQRPSMGWGTREQVTDPVYASKKFFTELQKVSGRKGMAITQAAQAVQRSAYPDAYAKWVDDAKGFLGKMGGGKIKPSTTVYGGQGSEPDLGDILGTGGPRIPGAQDALAASTAPGVGAPGLASPQAGVAQASRLTSLPPFASADDYVAQTGGGGFQKGVDNAAKGIVQYAKQFVGTPYVWGGTSPDGFDCSGFVQYVYKEFGVDLPRVSFQQANAGKRIGLDKLRAGDLVGWDNSSRNNGADHIAIYIGNGQIIEAPRPGIGVRVTNLYDQDQAWGVRIK